MKPFKMRMVTGWIPVLIFVFVCLPSLRSVVIAAELSSARVTQVIKDVRLLSQQAAARPASVNDQVNIGTAVRTGTDSRTELTFPDLTIARLGANTIFSFNQQARQLDLRDGAVLVAVPKNGASVKINTAAVTAAISGGTALFEYHPKMPAKLLILEGSGEYCSKLQPGECVTVGAGEMAIMSADGHLTQPTKFNAALVYKTSKLVTSFPTLPNADLILAVIDEQQQEFGGTSSSSASRDPNDPIDVTSTSVATTGTSTSGSSGKFGPPSAITQPNPYVITSGTQINTDPTITTNGITNFGKIYRGASVDGDLPTWLGSSPSAFDMVENIDCQTDCGGFGNPGPGSLPAAGFLFAGLQLAGDPTISNSSNYPLLAFVSQTGITTTGAGTVFTFGGTSLEVALIALNGSIDLSGNSFANFGQLFVYARGAGSNIILGSSISNVNRVQLRAEGDIQINSPVTTVGVTQDHRGFKALAGNNLVVNSTVTTHGGKILLQSLGGITVSSSAQLQSMLDSTGNSGQVIIYASGSDTTINVGGTVQAEQGEVDIRQVGVNGQTTLNNATIHGDVVKLSALGANGRLNIGTGNLLNADTILKLYAPGSNGTLNFLSNVTLSSPSNILAANTINIAQGVTVTINSPQAADVFTNNPNYFGFGGTGTAATSGTFGGAGAKNPQPLANAPPLGAIGQGP